MACQGTLAAAGALERAVEAALQFLGQRARAREGRVGVAHLGLEQLVCLMLDLRARLARQVSRLLIPQQAWVR